MSQPTDNRKTERKLLLAVLLVVFFGLALTFLGKRAATSFPPNGVNINTATAAELAQDLSISPSLARALALRRQTEPAHVFPSVAAFRRRLAGASLGIALDRLIVRTPAEAARIFWAGAAVFLLAFVGMHIVLTRVAPAADPFLLPLTCLLSGLGLMMVYTVTNPYRDRMPFVGQVWGIAVYGTATLLLPLSRPFGRLTLRRYQYVYPALAVLLLLLLVVHGSGPGGIRIRVFGFEPIEFIKILLVLFAVSYLAERRGMLGDARRTLPRLQDFAPLAAVYSFTLLLFLVVKDLGPAVLVFGTFLAVLYLATQRAIYPGVGIVLLLLAALVGYKAHFGFFVTRVTMWLHPWFNQDPLGAQLGKGLWGMATGGLAGSGLGLGDPAVVPVSVSDMIYAALGEQLGLIGTVTVLVVYVLLLGRGFRVALQAVTEFDRLLAAGLTTLLTLQAMIILGGVTGLVPLTGMALPFVSYGASSLVANFLALGLLLQISGKTLPSRVADRVAPEWRRAARVLVIGCGAYLVIGIGLARLLPVQGLQDTALATRPLYTRDADRVMRPHINPRLLRYAAGIPRGRILDRNGIVLARDATPDELDGTGLLAPDGRRRVYRGGSACAHLLAAVEAPGGPANPLGRNIVLRGFESFPSLLADYRRSYLPLAPRPRGRDVVLTIDSDLQRVAQDALRQYAGQVRDRRTGRPKNRGAAVVLNVATGEVLVAVTLPAFDPGRLTAEEWKALNSAADRQATLVDRAVSGRYPPGSAFKIVTAASALAHGLAQTVVVCHHTDPGIHWRYNGRYYGRRVTDEEKFVPHGETDLAKALRVSCNVYFAHVGVALGADALGETARTNFSLAHMPTRDQLGASLPDCAFGQGMVQVTPLEMARVAQAIANNGRMLPVTWSRPVRRAAPLLAMSPADAARLQQMLAGVTTDGTARGVFDSLPVRVAGKTGSAQNNQGDQMTHSWFAGFAPANGPTLAFACIIENGGAGRDAAAPVCREILRKALQ